MKTKIYIPTLHTDLFLQYRDRQNIVNRKRISYGSRCILPEYAQHLVSSKLVTCPRYSSKEALRHQGRAAEMVQAGPGSRILTECVRVYVGGGAQAG